MAQAQAISRSGSRPDAAPGAHAGWEAVIGLEVHAQLRTRAKLFSSAPNAFGAEPNTQTTEVDLGMPGVLPVLNRAAVELAVRAALALGCDVRTLSLFARKHYFYPDLPKGYQISQYEEPLAIGGSVPMRLDGVERAVPLQRIHMEEDAGKLIHDDAVTGGGASHVDLNRAGVPLIEIVSEPALYTPREAAAYLRTLRAILRYLEVSEGDMEKGHLRCDANVSVRRAGAARLGTRVEIKNLNSFRFLERAIAHEIARQVERLEEGGAVAQETRLWNERAGETRPMRSKEYASDYRYFPDPDLVPLRLDPAWIEAQRAALPELPHRRRARYEQEHGLPAADAERLAEDRPLADFFEATLALHPRAKVVANWLLQSVLPLLAERGAALGELALTPARLAELLELVESGTLTAANAREVLAETAASGAAPGEIARARGLETVSDDAALQALAREVVAAHPAQAARCRAGDAKLANFLVGQIMKAARGKANPAAVRAALERELAAGGTGR
jgi:aspartyl-tRNA(Asn)/glutamyl-tRNA(Gln) amidotransferase subunit B